jgi:hypothetical protein
MKLKPILKIILILSLLLSAIIIFYALDHKVNRWYIIFAWGVIILNFIFQGILKKYLGIKLTYRQIKK